VHSSQDFRQDPQEEQYAPFLGQVPGEGTPLCSPDEDVDLEDECGKPLMAHQAAESQSVLLGPPGPVLEDPVMTVEDSVDSFQLVREDAVMSVGSASSCHEELVDSRVTRVCSAQIEPTPAVNIDRPSRAEEVWSSDSEVEQEKGPPSLVASSDSEFLESQPRATRMTKAEASAHVHTMYPIRSCRDSRAYVVARPELGKVEPGFVSIPSASEDESSEAELRRLRDGASEPPTKNAKVVYENALLEASKGKRRRKTNPSSRSTPNPKGPGKPGPKSRLLPGGSTSHMDADNEPGSLSCGVASGPDDIEQLIGWPLSDLDSLSASLAMVPKSMSDVHRFRRFVYLNDRSFKAAFAFRYLQS